MTTAAPTGGSRLARSWLLAVAAVVLLPVLVVGLLLAGHWAGERPQVATINASLRAAERDLRTLGTTVERSPAEPRAFVCCGDGGPSGGARLKGARSLPDTIRAARALLLGAGWQLDELGSAAWFMATRGDLRVEVTILTVTENYDSDFRPGDVKIALDSR